MGIVDRPVTETVVTCATVEAAVEVLTFVADFQKLDKWGRLAVANLINVQTERCKAEGALRRRDDVTIERVGVKA